MSLFLGRYYTYLSHNVGLIDILDNDSGVPWFELRSCEMAKEAVMSSHEVARRAYTNN